MSSAISLSGAALAAIHEQFIAAMPAMENVIRFRFRRLPSRSRAEMIDDALAACWHAWSGLIRRGRDPISVGISAIAANACRYARGGRRLGTGTVGRGALDVFHPKAQKKFGFKVISLDRRGEATPEVRPETWRDGWRQWLALSNRVTPADEAAFRLDFARWLDGLPERKRQMAELLEGHETGAVARQLGVTPGAVSQTRTWLESSWKTFQGENTPKAAAPVRRPRGRPARSSRGAPARRPEVAAHVS
jgi:hypothetical protein